ncbi:MAG: TetR/AcrR family transcriptional regulator [Desulfobacter sp.]
MTTKRNTTKKRESILDGACQAFMEEGYDHTSMDRIADIAGASKRTVYNHFPSKEALFKAVLGRMMAQAMALKQISYDPDRSLEAQLENFADAKMEFIKNPAWLGLLKVTITVFISNPGLARETMKFTEDSEDTLAAWLAAAHDQGRLNVPSPALAAEAFWAMMGGAFILPVIFRGPMDAGEAREMKKELIAMFLARYTPGKQAR